MKKIGMIGGLSWVSTAAYYRLLNELMQQKLGGVSSAHLILESVNRQDYVEAVIERKDEEAACAMILSTAKAVERGGADFIVISCNDVHRFVPDVQPEIAIPFLHIAQATAEAIKTAGITSVALLGVRKTMEEPFYPEILKTHGITTIIPDEAQKTYIHDSIYDELVKDIFLDTTRARYVEIIGELKAHGAEGAILGCTEIPLLLGADDVDVPVFSTTDIHCKAAVERAVPR
ncbi:MAG: amino acid racemase [Hyphomicrobiaceae bacterium]|nr:amino acid racemase [Hyphomicrobiaceae bacterium]